MKELLVISKPNSSFSESIKTIRTNLKFSNINKKVKTIVVTSSVPGEGKSFISANLAAAFAGFDEKVLLVDCDLRRGRQHEIFNIDEKELGLSNLLIDQNFTESAKNYIKKTDIKNLFVLPMGTLPPNPSELLASEKNQLLIEVLEDKFDIIILDCPPLTGLNDTLIMANKADITIIVAKYKSTPMELVEKSKKSLENVNANVAGVVLNQIDDSTSSYYYNSYYTKK